jgi:lipopolysaccharide/colanic/teichoic acid biosynthesis glycosyltransferase
MSDAEIFRNTPVAGVASDQAYLSMKRVIEPVICFVLLLCLLPLMVVIALMIWVDSPGSPLYIQKRIGKDGRPFWMYKFRTMVRNHSSSEERKYMADFVAGRVQPNVDAQGAATFKSAKAEHITRVGRFLRKSSLDELPQLWNIVRGEMSLIGPRPNVPWEVAAYTHTHRQRLAALPGITGLAQVRGRSNIKFDEIVEHDIFYIRHQNLKLDMQIIWWTLVRVLGQQDAG